VGVNLIPGYRNLHVPSITKTDHSVTLRVTWMNNYQTASVSFFRLMGGTKQYEMKCLFVWHFHTTQGKGWDIIR